MNSLKKIVEKGKKGCKRLRNSFLTGSSLRLIFNGCPAVVRECPAVAGGYMGVWVYGCMSI